MYDYYITPEEYEIAEKNGIDYRSMYNRVYSLGWKKKRAMTEPIKRHRSHQSHKGWVDKAIENGIPAMTYYSRIAKGMTKEDASSLPTQNRSEWAKEMRRRIKRKYPDWVYDNLEKYNIPQSTFSYRVNHLKWSLEKASTKQPLTRGGRKSG